MNTQTTPPAPPAPQRSSRDVALRNFKSGLDQRAPEFARALPPQIPPERFTRVALTAVQNNPDLLDCTPQSVFNACMRAAQDGLLPDGRDGAIVKYGDEAQWLVMVGGIQKKARNSGEVASIIARVVMKTDSFRYWIDEEGEHLKYEPSDEQPEIANLEQARELVRCVFAMAKLKDGTILVEVMSVEAVARVQSMSRAKKDKSPWNQWWGEMAKKTPIRRLSKRLPSSSDLDDLIRRDDALYDLDKNSSQERAPALLDLSPQPKQTGDGVGSSQTAPGGGDEALDADNVDRAGGSGDAPPPPPPPPAQGSEPQQVSDGDKLLGEISNVLIDCKTHPDCEGVYKLFQKEIAEADARTQARVTILIEDKKTAISKANDESFPG